MPRKTEHISQEQVIAYMRVKHSDVLIYANWNEGISGSKGAQYGAMRKRLGVVAGIPDLFIAHPGKSNLRGMYIEMKAPNGKLSQNQKKIIPQLKDYYHVVVCYSADEAIDAIEGYLYDGI